MEMKYIIIIMWLFVAKDRFVQSAFQNRLIGLPLYYGAQLMLATSPTISQILKNL